MTTLCKALERAAWYLQDYAEMSRLAFDQDLEDVQTNQGEMIALAKQLNDLASSLGEVERTGRRTRTAAIIADVLSRFGLPGAVYYRRTLNRWRIVGVNYCPTKTEVLIGIYEPGVTAAELLEDMNSIDVYVDYPK